MQAISSPKLTSRHSVSLAMMAIYDARARALRRSYTLAYQKKHGHRPLSAQKNDTTRRTEDCAVWRRLARGSFSEQISALQSIRESHPGLVFEVLRSERIPFLTRSVNPRVLRVELVSGRPLGSGYVGLSSREKPKLATWQEGGASDQPSIC